MINFFINSLILFILWFKDKINILHYIQIFALTILLKILKTLSLKSKNLDNHLHKIIINFKVKNKLSINILRQDSRTYPTTKNAFISIKSNPKFPELKKTSSKDKFNSYSVTKTAKRHNSNCNTWTRQSFWVIINYENFMLIYWWKN